MKTDKKLIEIYEELSKVNDSNIEEFGNDITPMCFIIDKNFNMKILTIIMRNYEEKKRMQVLIMKIISSINLLGYIIMADTKMTKINLKTEETEVKDAVIRNLYTPKGVLRMESIIHKDKKIIKKEKIDIKKLKNNVDEWNLWGKHFDLTNEEDKKINDWYQNFKSKNPDLFNGVLK